MHLQQAQRQLTADLIPLYGSREAALIADWVLEHLTGRKRIDRLIDPAQPLSPAALRQYETYRNELLAHRPVQYVLNESWFSGHRFFVDENVLIPRPETEELVEWTAETIAPISTTGPSSTSAAPTILDVGTGSGCIAITLALKFPALPIHACDISKGALAVAARNAAQLGAPLTLHQLDFLDPRTWPALPKVKWLVSNPPYIPHNEAASMAPHVTAAEPSGALFVPESDPLVFYRALAGFARQNLVPDGSIFVEIHEDLASRTLEVFRAAGFPNGILRKDMQGRDRMIHIKAQNAPAAQTH